MVQIYRWNVDEKTYSSLWTESAQEHNRCALEIHTLSRKEFINKLTGFENTVSIGSCYLVASWRGWSKMCYKGSKCVGNKAKKILL